MRGSDVGLAAFWVSKRGVFVFFFGCFFLEVLVLFKGDGNSSYTFKVKKCFLRSFKGLKKKVL